MAQDGARPAGFLVLDKPAGISSARALNMLKSRFGPGVKLGHAGTLDPFATGVLVVLIGVATRQCERVMGLAKGYEATMCLGATTPTLDPASPPVPCAKWDGTPPTQDKIENVLQQFVGELSQVPPAFSAVKLGGHRAYDLARRGRRIELAPRRVNVHRLTLIEYEWPHVRIVLECGRGFYVRSLARDVGEVLGTGAYLRALRRTFVGPFDQALAVSPEAQTLPILPMSWLDGRA